MQETAQENSVINQTPERVVVVFDADAEQVVGLTLKQNGRKYKVAHVFRAMTDEEFFQYEQRKNIVQKITGTDVLNVQTEDKSLRAAEWLWDLLAVRRDGYLDRPDWKEKTNLLDKKTAIEKGLLTVFVFDSEEEELFGEEAESLFDDKFSDDISTVIQLDCLFNETPLTTSHYFRQPSAADVNDYEKTMKKATNRINARNGFRQKKNDQSAEIAIPSKARELCALYDRLIERTEGYKDRVPAHHKREAVLELFARESDVTEK